MTQAQGSKGFRDPWDLKRLGDNWSLLSDNTVLEEVCLDKLVSEHLKRQKRLGSGTMYNYIYYNTYLKKVLTAPWTNHNFSS